MLKGELNEKVIELNSLEMVMGELQQNTDKVVEKYIESVSDSEMKKDFMNYALLEHPKSPLAKLIVSAWNKFK